MNKRLLLVDDEVITLRLTRKLLANTGYEVEVASNSNDAIHLLTSQKFDLLIIDITMPTLSGFDLVQLMQSFDIQSPVIFLLMSQLYLYYLEVKTQTYYKMLTYKIV